MHRKIVIYSLESVCKSCESIRHTFGLASINNQPMRTATWIDYEIRTILEGHWRAHIPPIVILPILYLNPWAVSATWTWFLSVLVFVVSEFAQLGLHPNQHLLVICILPLADQIMYNQFQVKTLNIWVLVKHFSESEFPKRRQTRKSSESFGMLKKSEIRWNFTSVYFSSTAT